jgi:hypothetical protein
VEEIQCWGEREALRKWLPWMATWGAQSGRRDQGGTGTSKAGGELGWGQAWRRNEEEGDWEEEEGLWQLGGMENFQFPREGTSIYREALGLGFPLSSLRGEARIASRLSNPKNIPGFERRFTYEKTRTDVTNEKQPASI